MLGEDSRKSSFFLLLHPPGPSICVTRILIQAISLRHGEEGKEGGEGGDQQNLSRGVDSALRKGPESKILGADNIESSLFWFCIPRSPPFFSTHVLIQVNVLWHGEECGEGGEVEKQNDLSGGVDKALRNGLESKMLGTDSTKSLLFRFGILKVPQYL